MELIITEGNFEEEVLNAEVPVLVDFYADWCGPCKMMSPIIEELAKEFEGKVKIGKLNIDNNMNLAKKYGVMSIPTLILYKDKKVLETMIGARPKSELAELLGKL